MSSHPWGAALGSWESYRRLRQSCPGCASVGAAKAHELCRQRAFEAGTLVECWRLPQGSIPVDWSDRGTGGMGCRRVFIPAGGSSVLASPPEAASPGKRTQRDERPHLSEEIRIAWCETLYEYSLSQNTAHRPNVGRFYRDRDVPFDPALYTSGPGRIEAARICTDLAPAFLREHSLDTVEGLPGIHLSAHNGGFFFPAAKHGEAWEWSFDLQGRRRGWSRRFVHPDLEGEDHPKSKVPAGSKHLVHFCPGWREQFEYSGALLLTEGTRKANEAQRGLGIASLGLPSVAISPGPRAELQQLIIQEKPRLVYLAPDFADLVDGEQRHDQTRMQVLGWQWLVDFVELQGGEVKALYWDPSQGKGIDDVLGQIGWHEGAN